MNIIPRLFIVSWISSLDLFTHKVYAAEECVDQPGAVVLDGMETCEWVGAHNPKYRCGLDNSENACKLTCGTCECHDRRTFEGQFRGKTFRCGRLNRMPKKRSKIYCKKVPGAIENCQATCKDECQAPTTPAAWIQVGQDIDGKVAYESAGRSVSISADGGRVAIGCQGYNTLTNDWLSSVRVYDYDGSSWGQLGPDLEGDGDSFFGRSVSMSSDGIRVAVGAPLNNAGGKIDAGSVQIFEFDGPYSAQRGQTLYGAGAYDQFGTSVSLSSDGNRVAIGAVFGDGDGDLSPSSGTVYIYEYDGSCSWVQLGSEIYGEADGDKSGSSVSLSGDGTRVAIAARSNSNVNGSGSGQVRVYEYDGSSWTKLGQDIDGEAEYDYSGDSVSLSADGSRVAIGAQQNDGAGDMSGSVRVYEYDGSSWTQLGQDIDGKAAHDYAGESVSLSADGSRVAIGAPGSDPYGQVRVYEYDGSSWTQLGADIDGEVLILFNDYSVSLSADGGQVAIGAPGSYVNGIALGQVRVFSFE